MSTYIPRAETAGKSTAKPPNLRLSCDSCGMAKVKCSKERPACERCTSMQLKCVYGVSLRHGRPQRKKPQQSTSSLPGQERRTSAQIPRLGERQESYSSMLKESYLDLQRSVTDLGDVSAQNIDISVHFGQDWLDASPQTSEASKHADQSSAPFAPTYSEYEPPSYMISDAVESMTPSMSNFDPSYVSSGGNSPTISSEFSNTFDFDMNDAPDTPMSSSPPDSAPSRDVLPYPQHPACGQGPNSCAAIAWDTMTALETCTGAGISSESFTNPYAYAWTDDHDLQAGTLDEILRVNQRAITRIFEMLQCTCARKPDMAMLLGSIITKILAWHRRACSKSGDLDPYLPVDPLFPHPSGTTTPMSSQSSTGVNSPYRKRPWDHENMETINPAILSKLSAEPVRVGKFVPDDEVQGPIRRLLILSNLKKVRPMIDCLGRLSETYEDNASKNLFTMLRMWLREELSRTVKDVCQRTSVTDVGLISACG